MIQSPEYDDPNDLHKATIMNKPGAFLEKWQEILCAAEPVDLQRLPEDPAAANNKKDNSGPHRFFIGKSFTPSLLGDALLQELHIKKGYDQLWIYVNGVYKDYAERIIRKRAVEALEKEYRPARVEAVYKYIFDILPEEEAITNEEFINLKNGRLEWKTKKLHPHDPLKFEITQLPVNYMPSAVCPNFDNYLKTTLDPSTHPLIDEVLGYVLIPDTKIMQKAFMFTGAGANGKGVLLDVVEALLGSDNVSHVSLQTLEEDKFKSAELLGKLANIFADLDSSSLKGSSSFKTLTAGDAITGERKYGHPFKFRNYARLLFSANEIPGSRDRTYAFYRRWIIIPFEKTFKEGENADVNLTGKLTTPEELSGVLNRALEGLKRLFANSKPAFTIPQKVSKALDEYQKKNDIVAEFVDECVEKLPAGRVVKRHFYKTFKLWCDVKGYTRLSERVLKEGLERIYPDVGEVRSTDESGRSLPRCWTGIILNDNAPDPEPEESSFYGDDHDDKPY